eukprot:10220961-Ditylum_brightwellii.AAC.1
MAAGEFAASVLEGLLAEAEALEIKVEVISSLAILPTSAAANEAGSAAFAAEVTEVTDAAMDLSLILDTASKLVAIY